MLTINHLFEKLYKIYGPFSFARWPGENGDFRLVFHPEGQPHHRAAELQWDGHMAKVWIFWDGLTLEHPIRGAQARLLESVFKDDGYVRSAHISVAKTEQLLGWHRLARPKSDLTPTLVGTKFRSPNTRLVQGGSLWTYDQDVAILSDRIFEVQVDGDVRAFVPSNPEGMVSAGPREWGGEVDFVVPRQLDPENDQTDEETAELEAARIWAEAQYVNGHIRLRGYDDRRHVPIPSGYKLINKYPSHEWMIVPDDQ